MQNWTKILTIFCFGLLSLAVAGQNAENAVYPESQKTDITGLLPSLQTFLDSAEKNSPLLKIIDADIVIQQLRIKFENKRWLSNIGIDGSVRYGLFDNLILKEALGIEDLASSTTEQTRYALGIYVKIPITEILNTTEKKVAYNEKVKLTEQRASTLQELRKLVIVQYYNCISSYRKMEISNSGVESQRLQELRNEKDFQQGKIDLAEYSRQKDFFLKAKLELEDIKNEFYTALLILQETTGIKIQLKQ